MLPSSQAYAEWAVVEIAELRGVSKQRADQLRRRPDFPAPTDRYSRGDLWAASVREAVGAGVGGRRGSVGFTLTNGATGALFNSSKFAQLMATASLKTAYGRAQRPHCPSPLRPAPQGWASLLPRPMGTRRLGLEGRIVG